LSKHAKFFSLAITIFIAGHFFYVTELYVDTYNLNNHLKEIRICEYEINKVVERSKRKCSINPFQYATEILAFKLADFDYEQDQTVSLTSILNPFHSIINFANLDAINYTFIFSSAACLILGLIIKYKPMDGAFTNRERALLVGAAALVVISVLLTLHFAPTKTVHVESNNSSDSDFWGGLLLHEMTK